MEFRAEQPADLKVIREVNLAAFGRDNEANLVEQLRGLSSVVSFVAAESGQIIGHILFSPVEVVGNCGALPIWGLAPLAVLPAYQRRGVGSLLVRQSLAACTELGCGAVVVLGNPAFYSRFGFVTAKPKGLTCEYEVPDEAFMVLGLKQDALIECSGRVRYRPEFQNCE
ncbi:MAG: GNAT family N-acetyltransferase [Elainella sp.]